MNRTVGSELPISAQIEHAKPAGGEVIVNMENLIKQHIQTINTVTEELKKQKEMFDDALSNNPAYKEAIDRTKEDTKDKNRIKVQLLKQPQLAELNMKTKSMKGELKELKSALSDYLLEYQRMTEATQLELFSGEVVDIVKTAKVIKAFK